MAAIQWSIPEPELAVKAPLRRLAIIVSQESEPQAVKVVET